MRDEEPKITVELLRSWHACISGRNRFAELFPDGTDLASAIDGLVADNHDDWGYWLFAKAKEHAIYQQIVARGYRNSGDGNAGDRNSGNRNAGDRNAGNWNAGDRNAGNWNAGDRNAGNWNAGDGNAGDGNAGDGNAGNWNAGNGNAGNWNAGNGNAGNFNVDDPTTIRVFGREVAREVWESAYKPHFLYFSVCRWVGQGEMTNAEKSVNPNYITSGGYLASLPYKDAFKASWDNADPDDRIKVKDLPNFDAEIFFQISGIDLR